MDSPTRPFVPHPSLIPRRRAIAALVVGALTLAGIFLGGVGAEASGNTPAKSSTGPACTDTFIGGGGDSDFLNSLNWNTGKVPGPSDVACISAGTVTINGETASVGTLLLSGTLSLGDLCGPNGTQDPATLTTANGLTISPGSTVQMVDAGNCQFSDTINGGPITNQGTIQLFPNGPRFIEANLLNQGTVVLEDSNDGFPVSYNGAGTTFDNQGSVNLGGFDTLTVTGGASFVNDAGGSVNNTTYATGLLLNGGGTFTEGTGTTSTANNNNPVVVDDANVAYTGSGASVVQVEGSSGLSGNIAAGQTLQLTNTCNENVSVTVGNSFTNAGLLTMVQGGNCANNDTLIVSSGTLTNTGTIQATPSGQRTIQGNLLNLGTFSIPNENGFTATYSGSGSTFDNQGTVSVGVFATIDVTGGASFNNDTNGSISLGPASSTLEVNGGGTYIQGNGTTVGSSAVLVDDGNLVYDPTSGSGTSLVVAEGTDNLSGNVGAGQTLQIESTCSESAVVTAASSTSNAGTIILSNSSNCQNPDTLAGTLNSTGSLQTVTGAGGQRNLNLSLTNAGTVTIDTPTSDSGPLTNSGILSLADNTTLSAGTGSTITNASTGQIDASSATGSGLVLVTGGTFDEAGGTTLGANPVIVDDGTLNFSGTTAASASIVRLRGTSSLSGNILANETLQLESTCSENAAATAATGFTNSGTIVETNGDGCGNNVTLTLKKGTLANDGTIQTVAASGGQRIIKGSISNAKTMNLGAGIGLQVQGSYTQTSKGNLLTNIASSGSFGSMAVTGKTTLAGDGQVSLQNAFVPSLGQSYGIVTGNPVSGKLAKLTNAVLDKPTATYLQPNVASTALTFVVVQAAAAAPTSAAPGQVVAVSGSEWTPNETVSVTFTDKAGRKTTLTPIVADGTGSFSASEKIPSTAAAGTGRLVFSSKITGVSVTDTITIS